MVEFQKPRGTVEGFTLISKPRGAVGENV